uniref:Selenoprotein M n=1 Tax=Callorhinchus milii TaxID=7868 RepID=A0A4W3JC44_CALMI|eukprot:gi/632967649/ref/XP_007900094.1/ PREDICTED: selenoprotein M-like [Callorhinchus milii]
MLLERLIVWDVITERFHCVPCSQVKAFIEEDLPLYHNLLLRYSSGSHPELVLLNYVYVELDRIPINQMSQEEINELLQDLGFFKKRNIDDLVPEDMYFSPLRGLPNPRPSLLKKGLKIKRLVNQTEDMKEDL